MGLKSYWNKTRENAILKPGTSLNIPFNEPSVNKPIYTLLIQQQEFSCFSGDYDHILLPIFKSCLFLYFAGSILSMAYRLANLNNP
jgi:hypothetical protein